MKVKFTEVSSMQSNSNSTSILLLLRDRESGYTSKGARPQFSQVSREIADSFLITSKFFKNVDSIYEMSYGVSAAFNRNGHVAIARMYRTVGIIDMRRAFKVQVLDSINMSIFCMAYHPVQQDLLAIGGTRGWVQIYKDYAIVFSKQLVVEQQPNHFDHTVYFICFHPKPDLVLISYRRDVRLLNWNSGDILTTVSACSPIKFFKFNTLSNMLVTIQEYAHKTTLNCITNCFNMIGSVGLILSSIFEPSSVGHVFDIFLKNLESMCCSCSPYCYESEIESNLAENMISDLETTRIIWEQKLRSLNPQAGKINDHIKCDFFFNKIRDFIQQCPNAETKIKDRLNEFILKVEEPIKVAIQETLRQSWILRREYYRLRCTFAESEVLTSKKTEIAYKPNVVQVWGFHAQTGLKNVWHAPITSFESYDDYFADISKCEKKIAVYKKSRTACRLQVFSLERYNLGLLLHNIDLRLGLDAKLIGLTFSSSGKYLVSAIRCSQTFVSHINVVNLSCKPGEIKARWRRIDKGIDYVSCMPNPADGALLIYMQYRVSRWV